MASALARQGHGRTQQRWEAQVAAVGSAKEPSELLGPFQLKSYKNPNQLKP